MKKQFAVVGLGVALTSAGGAFAQDESSRVEKCNKTLGTLAVAEPQDYIVRQLSGYGLGSPLPLLRLIIQESGCFAVVERGVAMQNLKQERALAEGGDLQGNANVGKGQLQAADFVMTPSILFSSNNSGGIGGALAGLGVLGRVGGLLGGLKFKEAQTSLLVADVRSGIQVAAAQGSASKTDFSLGGWAYGGGILGALGGYTNTPEGKVIAASLLDNYNKIVLAVRDKPSLVQATVAASTANAEASVKAGKPVAAGEVLRAKIAKVKVFDAPNAGAKVLATLTKEDELVASGDERNGFVQVDSANFAGAWVQKTLVSGFGR